jgi:putative phage-type endonuclease
LGRFAVSLGVADVTISPIPIESPDARLDVLANPLAVANEPGLRQESNMFAESRIVDTGSGAYAIVCLFACHSVNAGEELQWLYGSEYETLRNGYAVGEGCRVEPARLQDPLEMLLACLAAPRSEMVAFEIVESSQSTGSDEDFDPATSVNTACDVRSAMLKFGGLDTSMKRNRRDILLEFNPYDDADGALAITNEVVLTDPGRGFVQSAMTLLSEYISDQCSGRTVIIDCESTEAMRRDLSPSDLKPSCTTLLILEEVTDDPESSGLVYQFWPSNVPRGAPYELLDVALDSAERIVAFNGIFDLKLLAQRRSGVYERWNERLHDPFKLIRDAGLGTFKLDALLKTNGLPAKPGSGLEAVRWWQARSDESLDKLAYYNEQDVVLLARLCQQDSIRLPTGESTRVGTFQKDRSEVSSSGSQQRDDTKIVQVQQRSPDWFALRRNRVTSTLVAAICGLSPFLSREDAHDTLQGTETSRGETEAMRRGIEREAEAIRRYEALTGNTVDSVGFVIPTDERYKDWTGASPDGIGRDDKKLCIEVKVPSNGRPTPKPSTAYFLQCQWHMFCSGRVYCDFVSLGKDSVSISRVRRDDDLVKFLMPHLRAFWEHAQTDDEFELDLDMRDRVDIREEVNASLAESVGDPKLVRFTSR